MFVLKMNRISVYVPYLWLVLMAFTVTLGWVQSCEYNSGCCVREGYDVFHMTNVVKKLPKVFAFEGYFSLDDVESAKWHQLCFYNITKHGCVKNKSMPCYCEVETPHRIILHLNLPQNRKFSGMLCRATGGTFYRQMVGQTVRLEQVYSGLKETLWVDGRSQPLRSGKSCAVEIVTNSKSNLTFCVTNTMPHTIMTLYIIEKKITHRYGNCVTRLLNVASNAVTSDDSVSFGVFSSGSCPRRKMFTCTFRKISPDRLSLEPFNPLHSGSPCDEGVTEGDYFYFKGWIDVKGVNLSLRRLRIEIQQDTEEGLFSTIHSVDLEYEGCDDRQRSDTAYCYMRNSSKYYFIINKTATFALDNRRLRLWWPFLFGYGDASWSQKIPTIHKKVSATVEVEGKVYKMSLPFTDVGLPLQRGKVLHFKFCVKNVRRPYFMEMHAEPSWHKGLHSSPCMEVYFYDSCRTRKTDFRLFLVQNKGCRKLSKYVFPAMPVIKIGGHSVDMSWETSGCPFALSNVMDSAIEICLINVAKPYRLITTIRGKKLDSSENTACINIPRLRETGRLTLHIIETMCNEFKHYSCVVSRKRTTCILQNPALMKPLASLTYINPRPYTVSYFDLPCLIHLKPSIQYSMKFCLSNLPPPYNIQIFMNNTWPPLNFTTNSCVTFSHRAKGEFFPYKYVFIITDYCKYTKTYTCFADLAKYDKLEISNIAKETAWTVYYVALGIIFSVLSLVTVVILVFLGILNKEKAILAHSIGTITGGSLYGKEELMPTQKEDEYKQQEEVGPGI